MRILSIIIFTASLMLTLGGVAQAPNAQAAREMSGGTFQDSGRIFLRTEGFIDQPGGIFTTQFWPLYTIGGAPPPYVNSRAEQATSGDLLGTVQVSFTSFQICAYSRDFCFIPGAPTLEGKIEFQGFGEEWIFQFDQGFSVEATVDTSCVGTSLPPFHSGLFDNDGDGVPETMHPPLDVLACTADGSIVAGSGPFKKFVGGRLVVSGPVETLAPQGDPYYTSASFVFYQSDDD